MLGSFGSIKREKALKIDLLGAEEAKIEGACGGGRNGSTVFKRTLEMSLFLFFILLDTAI